MGGGLWKRRPLEDKLLLRDGTSLRGKISAAIGATLHGGQRAGGRANASRLFSLAFVKEESS